VVSWHMPECRAQYYGRSWAHGIACCGAVLSAVLGVWRLGLCAEEAKPIDTGRWTKRWVTPQRSMATSATTSATAHR
jgi:hypothetical protein